MELKTHLHYDISIDQEKLYIYYFNQYNLGQKRYFVEPIKIREVPQAQEAPCFLGEFHRADVEDNIMFSTRDFLQTIMDVAWNLGMRPKNYADYSNEIKAVRYHLEDMRKLAKVIK